MSKVYPTKEFANSIFTKDLCMYSVASYSVGISCQWELSLHTESCSTVELPLIYVTVLAKLHMFTYKVKFILLPPAYT